MTLIVNKRDLGGIWRTKIEEEEEGRRVRGEEDGVMKVLIRRLPLLTKARRKNLDLGDCNFPCLFVFTDALNITLRRAHLFPLERTL